MVSRSIPFVIVILFMLAIIWQGNNLTYQIKQKDEANKMLITPANADTPWHGADSYQIPFGTIQGSLIWYGQQLIANTAYYLGPAGVVAHISNGMNCQNCHLQAGTLPFANNFGKTYATYPQFRARSNSMQTIYGRITDCFQRSLNGTAPDTATLEMRAMYAYIKWLGQDVAKNANLLGTGSEKLPYLNRAANAAEGQRVYIATCSSCHGVNGQGQLGVTGSGYAYPPLWGANSYNDGAGLYRVGAFAGYVKNNMPLGTTYHTPQLSVEQAWDVAAFVNSQPRPHKDQSMDWPNIRTKPVDFPFGPYIDSFSEQQHKYGPFKPIVAAAKKEAYPTLSVKF